MKPLDETPRLEIFPGMYGRDFWEDMSGNMWACDGFLSEHFELKGMVFIRLRIYKKKPHKNAVRVIYRKWVGAMGLFNSEIVCGRHRYDMNRVLRDALDKHFPSIRDHVFYLDVLDETDWWVEDWPNE